jgi:putative NADH-flavin reductase
MRIAIVGATGKSGNRILSRALAAGHEVTALVRDRDKLLEQLGGDPPRLSIRQGDAEDAALLRAALDGCDAAVQCALTPADGERFFALASSFTRLAEQRLVGARRVWMYGGAAALTIRGTSLLGVDLPGMPAMYQLHRRNWEVLRESSLDWSFACPGPMIHGEHSDGLRLSVDVFPLEPPSELLADPGGLMRWMGSRLAAITVTYDDVAHTIVEHLDPGGELSRHRVGFAPPPGQERNKEGWTLGQPSP